jgi:hypothetical protein
LPSTVTFGSSLDALLVSSVKKLHLTYKKPINPKFLSICDCKPPTNKAEKPFFVVV